MASLWTPLSLRFLICVHEQVMTSTLWLLGGLGANLYQGLGLRPGLETAFHNTEPPLLFNFHVPFSSTAKPATKPWLQDGASGPRLTVTSALGSPSSPQAGGRDLGPSIVLVWGDLPAPSSSEISHQTGPGLKAQFPNSAPTLVLSPAAHSVFDRDHRDCESVCLGALPGKHRPRREASAGISRGRRTLP